MKDKRVMKYLKIPIRSYEEAKSISDDIFGAMMWDDSEKSILKAYPYDSYNPVIMEIEKD